MQTFQVVVLASSATSIRKRAEDRQVQRRMEGQRIAVIGKQSQQLSVDTSKCKTSPTATARVHLQVMKIIYPRRHNLARTGASNPRRLHRR